MQESWCGHASTRWPRSGQPSQPRNRPSRLCRDHASGSLHQGALTGVRVLGFRRAWKLSRRPCSCTMLAALRSSTSRRPTMYASMALPGWSIWASPAKPRASSGAVSFPQGCAFPWNDTSRGTRQGGKQQRKHGKPCCTLRGWCNQLMPLHAAGIALTIETRVWQWT